MGWTVWPAAEGAAWEPGWSPYPGVWLAMIGGLLLYASAVSWLRHRDGAILETVASKQKLALFVGGVLVLWLALDWPLGSLATNLLTARIAQFLLIALVAAPLLLLGSPAIPTPALSPPRWMRAVLRLLIRPLVAASLFAAVIFASHLAPVVNALEPSPAGAAGLRATWLAVALLYWYPLLGPGPERDRLPYLGAVAYLVLPFLLPKAPGVVYVFATSPLYEPYAHDAHAWGLSTTGDQGIAGFLLWIVGSLMVLVAVYLVFRHWSQEERSLRHPDSLALPADPEALGVIMSAPGGWQATQQLLSIIDDSLPPHHRGVSLSMRVRRRRTGREWREQVVMVIHLAASEQDQQLLQRRVAAQFLAHLAHYDPLQRDAIVERLTLEVEPLGTRVQ